MSGSLSETTMTPRDVDWCQFMKLDFLNSARAGEHNIIAVYMLVGVRLGYMELINYQTRRRRQEGAYSHAPRTPDPNNNIHVIYIYREREIFG